MVDGTPESRLLAEDLSIVIPLFNASSHVSELLDALANRVKDLSFRSIEIVLVDDCSTDQTVEMVKQRSWNSRAHLRLVELHRNAGQAHASAIGVAHASGTIVVTIDDDLQHPVSEIPTMARRLREGNLDFVVARLQSQRKPGVRRIASRIATLLARRALGVGPNHDFSSFCAFDRSFIQRLPLLDMPQVEIGWMYRYSSRFDNVDVDHLDGLRPASNYSLSRLLRVSRPLRSFLVDQAVRGLVYIGVSCAIVAFVLTVYYLQLFVRVGELLPGFATIVLLLVTNLAVTSFFLAALVRIVSRTSSDVRFIRLGRAIASGDLDVDAMTLEPRRKGA